MEERRVARSSVLNSVGGTPALPQSAPTVCLVEKEWTCRSDQAGSICSKHLNYSSTNLKCIAVMTSGPRCFLGQLHQFMSLSEISHTGRRVDFVVGSGQGGRAEGRPHSFISLSDPCACGRPGSHCSPTLFCGMNRVPMFSGLALPWASSIVALS